jgi:hypothetical protein
MTKIGYWIDELTILWLSWLKFDKIARSESCTYKERRTAAIECERLITKRHEIISRIDELFE